MFSAARRHLFTSSNMVKIDSAVAKLLQLDPANTSVSSHGGGGMSSASTAKISTKLSNGSTKLYFMKTGVGKDAEIMFRGMQHLPPTYHLNTTRTTSTNNDTKANMHPSTPSITLYPPSVLPPSATATSPTNLANHSS